MTTVAMALVSSRCAGAAGAAGLLLLLLLAAGGPQSARAFDAGGVETGVSVASRSQGVPLPRQSCPPPGATIPWQAHAVSSVRLARGGLDGCRWGLVSDRHT